MTTQPASEPDLMQLMPLALGFLSSAEDTAQLVALKHKLRAWAKEDPMDAMLATILGGGLAFYLAEKASNPEVESPWDGISFVVQTMSVGTSSDMTPTTPAGRALAMFVQAFGPALAFSVLGATGEEQRTAAADQRAMQLAVIERLDRIVQLLEAKA